jgi:hypothetical protein
MATHFETSDDHVDPTLYCPCVEAHRKTDSHTMRKRGGTAPSEHVVKISRPKCEDGVPITEMDKYFNDRYVFIKKASYRLRDQFDASLGKNGLFDNFTYNIEELCDSKTITFNKDSMMIVTAYKVPIIGYMSLESSDYYSRVSRASPATPATRADSDTTHDEKYIMIHGKLYSPNKYYREVGLEFCELVVPRDYFSPKFNVGPDEHAYVPHKTSSTKEFITFSFHHDVTISSIVVKPEMMTFKKIHSDNSFTRYDRQNTDLLRKQKYAINVLENEPGFVSKFVLTYRSELTDGKWVKHGIYNGNVSIVDSVKISFDEIQVKEIRITPISFHKSFEKIRLSFVGKAMGQPKSDELFVTYEMSTPRDGHYQKYSSKVSDKTYTPYKEFRDYKEYLYENNKRFNKFNIRECMRDY